MKIVKVTSESLLFACRKTLAKNPVVNVLPLGDLYSPLLRVSDVYAALEDDEPVGVCSIYHAFSAPSIALSEAEPHIKKALAEKAISNISSEFIALCPHDDLELLKQYSHVVHSYYEQQMIAEQPKIRDERIKVERVSRSDLNALSEFYKSQQAQAWVPIQFEVGPYYCVRSNGKIVSAAGVHIVTPQIAQLGNIVTDKSYRHQGFAKACTYALTSHLARNGRIISLYVRTDNSVAISMYQKLGFSKKYDVVFSHMKKS